MCGIFGFVVKPESHVSPESFRRTVDTLFTLSETRGKEAAGFAIRSGDTITVYKEAQRATRMIRSARYDRLMSELLAANGSLAFIGHSRLVTNGMQTLAANNQPVVKNRLVGVHNGIIVNDAQLWERHPHLHRESEVDTEALLAVMDSHYGASESLNRAVCDTFREIEGAASIAVLPNNADAMALATNTGSLYCGLLPNGTGFVFTSERYILNQLLETEGLGDIFGGTEITHVQPGHGIIVTAAGVAVEPFSWTNGHSTVSAPTPLPADARIVDLSQDTAQRRAGLRRCSKCILPETMPFIEFDADGVCNYCRQYQTRLAVQGLDALREVLEPYRNNSGEPDCLVAFSGGRDSSYGLHLLKTELGMNPIAFTYDWGMVTDLARRNQARLCGKLGVEHILISADIKKKRKHIRKNVEAWLRQPELGMIPLFMAGDKLFFYHANRLKAQLGLDLDVFCVNPLEKTDFKLGFCGVNEGHGHMYFTMPFANVLRVTLYYALQYAKNPRYFNESLLDTFAAYASSFFAPKRFVSLFDYVRWDEAEIDTTLRREYDWEIAKDTTTTWRIGDGTAAFYNYIYYTLAGFSENDTFRSNQIREGVLTREEALTLVERENQPRWESIRWYAQAIGIDCDEALNAIHAAPKLYTA